MTTSDYSKSEIQPLLWDEPLGNHGHIRTVIGDLAEQLTAKLMNGRRHRTQTNVDYCPDVSSKQNGQLIYFESKAVGLSKTAFVYSGRLARDREFVASGHDLSYVVWHHAAETCHVETVDELRSLVLLRLQTVFVIPFVDFNAICGTLKQVLLNSAYGRCRERSEYGMGVRLPLSLLKEWELPGWESKISYVRELF